MLSTQIRRSRSRSRSRCRGNRRQTLDHDPTNTAPPSTVQTYPQLDFADLSAPLPPALPTTTFAVQLAHGSEMKRIRQFASLDEMYQLIREAFPDAPTVLFCTTNTHKVDMDRLLSSNVGLADVIYAHLAGVGETISLEKTEANLGLTITDNGAGVSFIKRIREGSVAERAGLRPGQHIAKVDGVDMWGARHYEVARFLRSIDEGKRIVFELVNPLQSGFSFVGARSAKATGSKAVENGGMTLRLKADGASVLQAAPDASLLSGVNSVFESYLGVHDDQLALLVAEMAAEATDLIDLKTKIGASELAVFQLPEEFVFDVWGVLTDLKAAKDRNDEE